MCMCIYIHTYTNIIYIQRKKLVMQLDGCLPANDRRNGLHISNGSLSRSSSRIYRFQGPPLSFFCSTGKGIQQFLSN